jgi:decaprenyl-phosphate phosphoribosyltransferase
MIIKPFFSLMRPEQYVKNLFIFLPLFFGHKINHPALFADTFVAFVAFSLTASAVYILNDCRDIEADRQHPLKKNRPLASGAISKHAAFILMVLLLVTGLSIMGIYGLPALGILLFYVLLNIAYTFYMKYIAIVDVSVIAIGFVLRLFVGSQVTDIHLSMWIVVMTFLLALFIALAKRRDDVLIFLDTGKKMRKVVDGYNLQFLDAAMIIMASVVIVAYTLFTTSTEVVARVQNPYLYLTAFFVIIGILRYMQTTFVKQRSASPTYIILHDRFIQLILLGWISTFAWILYL